MAGTLGQLERSQFFGARRPATYISARAAVTANEQISVPAGATHVLLSGSLPFYAAFGANPVAVVATDDDTGASSELIHPATPIESRTFLVSKVAKIGVVAETSASITATFFTI